MSNSSVELEQFFETFEELKKSHEKIVLLFKVLLIINFRVLLILLHKKIGVQIV
jgi:hypothetical protein